MGLKNQQEDVGQTLGAYGFNGGCYFVMPILGPTTIRDSLGMIADTFVDPFSHITLRDHSTSTVSNGHVTMDFRSSIMALLTSKSLVTQPLL